jgi:hypothetical protein
VVSQLLWPDPERDLTYVRVFVILLRVPYECGTYDLFEMNSRIVVMID